MAVQAVNWVNVKSWTASFVCNLYLRLLCLGAFSVCEQTVSARLVE